VFTSITTIGTNLAPQEISEQSVAESEDAFQF